VIDALRDILLWHYGSITMPEIVWTVVTFCGVIFSTLLYRHVDTSRDVLFESRALFTALDFRIMNRFATNHMRSEVRRIAAHAIKMTVGVIFMTIPPVNPDHPVTIGGWIVALTFITSAALNVDASLQDLRARNKTLTELREEEENRVRLAGLSIH
jgi:hypothetical protein